MTVMIERAGPADAERILALQQLAYRSEARLYDDWAIPPLTQTLDALREEIVSKIVLKALDDVGIVGSVRGCARDGTGYVERLIVHPDRQGKGIGTRLMSAIEAALAPVRRYELFTGHRSEQNLSLYRHLGYSIVRREPVHAALEFVYLQKLAV